MTFRDSYKRAKKKRRKRMKGDTKLKTVSKYFLGSSALNEIVFHSRASRRSIESYV